MFVMVYHGMLLHVADHIFNVAFQSNREQHCVERDCLSGCAGTQ